MRSPHLAGLLVILLLAPLAAHAGNAEVKDVARQNNCAVTSIETIAMHVGQPGDATYKVGCAVPAGVDEAQKKAAGTLYVHCVGNMCTAMQRSE